MNLVLYRKYRPQTFGEVIGQEHVVQTLTNAISNGMISHAYLFAGPRGTGKTTIARLLAKAVNCQNLTSNIPARQRPEPQALAGGQHLTSNYEPCNKCSSCLEINKGNAIDLIEIDAASNRGIDEIRELRDGIRFVPTKSKYKVFIIDESHQLTKEAANALLKTLEEPPSHAIFVLATTEIQKMIPTIISRCQRFDFRKLTLPEITKELEIIAEKEGIKIVLRQSQDNPEHGRWIEKAAIELIASNSQGALRDAIGMLDQAITFCTGVKDKEITVEEIKNLLGLVEINVVSQFVDFLKDRNALGAVNFLNEIYEKGSDLEVFARALINYLRQILILKISSSDFSQSTNNPIITGLTGEELQKLQNQANAFKEEDIQRIIKLFLEAVNKMKYSPIPQLQLELAIVESCASPVGRATAEGGRL